MSNPFGIATRGKGFFPMLSRGRAIVSRYGFTARKMDNALMNFSNLLRQYSCSATIPVTASALALNPAVAEKYYKQGLELAIHGFKHIDYSELGFEKQLEHLRQAKQIFQDAGMKPTGFRCPYLRWNSDTLKALSTFGMIYDSSQALAWDVSQDLETGVYHRALGFYRSRSINDYPALPRLVNGLIRIPYCLPDDEALVERLHTTDITSMSRIWLDMLESTYQAGELFTLGLHPERVPFCHESLRAVLVKAQSLYPRVWIARLDEMADWFLGLGKTTYMIQQESPDRYHISINAPKKATILARSLDVLVSTRDWSQGYCSIQSHEFTIRSNKRPVIGISPRSPDSLQGFLRHLGYLIEINPDQQAYSIYLDRDSFTEKDERLLLTELSKESAPIVRLSCWPEEARSGLAITGDVDAFTLLDYGQRLWNV